MLTRIHTLLNKAASFPPFVKEITIVILLILICIFTYKVFIFASSMTLFGDATKYNGYFIMLIKYSLINFGQFGFWDHLSSFGTSWISNPSGYHFSPLAWITISFFNSPLTGIRFMELSYIILGAISFYFLMRVVGASRLTSFLISIPYVANEYPILFARNGWFEELMGIYLLPLTVLFLWLGITRKSYFFIIIGSLVMSLHFFDNSFYVFHYNTIVLLWVGLVLILHSVFVNRHKQKTVIFKTALSHLLLNFVFWITFVGISAIKLIPLFEFRNLSARASLPLNLAEIDVIQFSVLIERLSYFFIPKGHTTSFTILSNQISVALVLICILYFLIKRSLVFGIFVGLLFIGVWGYLANRVPIDLYQLFYYFLPGFNSNKYPYRFFIIIHFAFMVCVALGLDLLIRKKSNLILKGIGVIFGFIIIASTVFYTITSFSPNGLYEGFNLQKAVDEVKNFRVIKQSDLSIQPSFKGKIPDNLLVALVKIMNAYNPEGRLRSTLSQYLYSPRVLSNTQLLAGHIYSVHDSYETTTLNYKYGIIPFGNTQDAEDKTKNRYKILSVLNARFQIQDKQNLEFWGCKKLELETNTSDIKPKESICQFLENRLVQIVKNQEGAIYYDKEVLPKVTLISNPILLVSDNRFSDFSAFIAKQILFHPDFDEEKITILSSKKDFEDYSLDELKNFTVIILVDLKIKNKNAYKRIKNDYQKTGKTIELDSTWINYDSLHKRSVSLWTDKPAWRHSQKDKEILSSVFKLLPRVNDLQDVQIQKFSPEDLIFEVKTQRDNMVLQFSDSYYPGWKATIDGEIVPVYMADGLVKGVVIPKKGTHIVRLYYSPDPFRNGAIISIITLSITLVFLLLYHRKRLVRYAKRIFTAISRVRRYFLDISYRNSVNMKIKNKFSKALKTFKNILLDNSNMFLGAIVLSMLLYIYLPVFKNTITSAGDLPYYFDTYIKSLSIPQVWNPHWPGGLGGNQTIILPLKFYIQLPIPLLVNSFGLPWEIVQKTFLFGVFLSVAIFSSYFLTRSWIGTLIYTTNTWILMVFTGGQMGIALSYAIVPLVLALFIRLFDRFSLQAILITGLIFSLEIIFDQRIAYLTLLAVLIFLALKLAKNPQILLKIEKRILLFSLIPIIVFFLNAFWIFPILFSKIVGIDALQVIASVPGEVGFFSFAFLENSISLLHPNFPENMFGKISFMKPEFLIIPLIAYGGLLFIKNSKTVQDESETKNDSFVFVFFAFLGLIGAFLAKGANEPFGAIYVWLFDNFPGFNFFRDPTKFYIFVALSYGIIIPFTLKEMLSKFRILTKRFLKKDFGVISFYILSIVFLIFWVFTIRQVLLNQVGGLFKENRIPTEYTQLKEHLESEPKFFRTLWLPARSRFGYFSNTHPSIDGYDVFDRIGEATMVTQLKKQEVISLLRDMSIKYVIVPYDSEGEIFLTDREYDENKYKELTNGLFAISELKHVSNFGKLSLFEVQNQEDHFFIESANGVFTSQIDYQAISPVKYLVNVKGAKKGDMLVFSESYDLGWQLSSPGLKIFPIPYRNSLNGFVLPSDGQYTFELFYSPQNAANIGFIVSATSLLLVISMLVWFKIRR